MDTLYKAKLGAVAEDAQIQIEEALQKQKLEFEEYKKQVDLSKEELRT